MDELQLESAEDKKIQFLVKKFVKERVSRKKERDQIVRLGLQYEQLMEDYGALARAYLTREALKNLETISFPNQLYYNNNLNRYTKWVLALSFFKTPVLDQIRALLSKDKVSYEDFALAVDNIHSIVSNKYAHPKLEMYAAPRKKEEIVKFCSFLNLVEVKIGQPSSDEQGEGEQREEGQELQEGQQQQEDQTYMNTPAAQSACWAAFRFRESVTPPEIADAIRNAPTSGYYTATVVVQNVNEKDSQDLEAYFDEIIKSNEYISNRITYLETRKIPNPGENKKNPKTEKRSKDFDVVFSLICKSRNSDKEEYADTMIKQRLTNKYIKNPIIILTGPTFDFLNVPDTFQFIWKPTNGGQSKNDTAR